MATIPDVIEQAQLTRYMRWLAREDIVTVETYQNLWQWSVTELELFWESLWSYFDLKYSQKWDAVLPTRQMPGANWFVGAKLNYAENIFSRMNSERPMILFQAEGQELIQLSWAEIYDQVAMLAATLRGLGVKAGDRVVAYIPNIPEAVISLLAVTSIGAIWSSCSPDFGADSVLSRFVQIQPKVLIAVDGYQYGGKVYDRRDIVKQIQTAIPDLEHTILISRQSDQPDDLLNTISWQHAVNIAEQVPLLQYEQVDFSHPLWILYSSGTTGNPKPIVHSHGGIVLEHAKATTFHNDLHEGDRFFWYSSTGWMMWNYVIGSLLSGATIILYDGHPMHPHPNALFELAEKSQMTYFGTSAAFISACMKRDLYPNQAYDLHRIRGLGSTGSPLSMDGFRWVYQHIQSDLALESLSGGTDLCTAFVGGARTLPIYAGVIQGASLGAKVEAYDANGKSLVDEMGELVITEPMPSMPIYFWGDDSQTRYQDSYFSMYPGIWRHGDWIKIDQQGGCVIYGRSDSTINRHGIRMGTGEIYEVVESFDEVADSLIVDLELLGRKSRLLLFLVLQPNAELSDQLTESMKQKIRQTISPRHVPDDLRQIDEVPYTLSGKKMEVPIRKILLGMDYGQAANQGAMRNPESLGYFISLAKEFAI